MIIILPWPSPKLSPNARVHWSEKKRITAALRHECYWLTMHIVGDGHAASIRAAGPLSAQLTFHAPNKRSRDIDNCIASCKAAIDGVAAAIGIDDSQIKVISGQFGEPIKAGEVQLILSPYLAHERVAA